MLFINILCLLQSIKHPPHSDKDPIHQYIRLSIKDTYNITNLIYNISYRIF